MEVIQLVTQWLEALPAFAKILSIVLIVNAVLSGLAATLEKVAVMTDTKADDKAAELLGKVVKALAFIVDLVSANRKHK